MATTTRSGRGTGAGTTRTTQPRRRSGPAKAGAAPSSARLTSSRKGSGGKRPAGSKADRRPSGRRTAGGARTGSPGGGVPRKTKRRNPNRWRFYVLLAVLGVVIATVLWFVVGRDALASFLDNRAQQAQEQERAAQEQAEAEAQEAAAPDPANPVACEAEVLDAELALNPASPKAGEELAMTVAVTNSGEVPCLLDLGHQALQVEITSGDDEIWSTSECPRGAEERMLLLDVEDGAEQRITWNGQRCGNDSDAKSGTYRITATVTSGAGSTEVDEVVELS